MRSARTGEGQADRTTTLLLTLSEYGMFDAAPILVPPAVAVLFIGAPYQGTAGAIINLALTFDHRLINSVAG